MSVTDPIADMLTRVRNAVRAKHDSVEMPTSTIKLAIAKILKEEGFVRDFEIVQQQPQNRLRLWISYTGKRQPVLNGLKRISRPGLRVYRKSTELPRVVSGMGVAIISTPQGVMTAHQARRKKVGGEVLCFVW
ncbi:MAG: 30S ribosomal protein S8 [Chloroflexi bacterium]|nr:30S ribosomal protein S8 [Chloroflexota bacterium]